MSADALAFVRDNADRIAKFKASSEPIQRAHQEATMAAEKKFADTVAGPLPPLRLANISYWTRHEPTLNSYRAKWREMEAEQQLRRELDAIDAHFSKEMADAEAKFFGGISCAS